MFETYVKYLEFLNGKLAKFFESQKPYIFCKKGCAMCCKHSQLPYSLLEVNYLLSGFLKLDKETQKRIENNIIKTLQEKKNYKGDEFLYDCPFLIDNVCSVYEYRGIICRTFGLMMKKTDGKITVPFCCYEGYNYSNVIDLENKKISEKKVKERGFPEEPLGFNVSYEYLTDHEIEHAFQVQFGLKKPLIDWFISG